MTEAGSAPKQGLFSDYSHPGALNGNDSLPDRER